MSLGDTAEFEEAQLHEWRCGDMGNAKLLAQLASGETPEGLLRQVQLSRCPYCRRRSTLVESKSIDLAVAAGDGSDVVLVIPRYEVLPCCTARYAKTVEHVTRKQKLRQQEFESKSIEAKTKIATLKGYAEKIGVKA